MTAATLAAAGCSPEAVSTDGPFGTGGSPGSTCNAIKPGASFTKGDQIFRNTDGPARITALGLAGDHHLELLGAWIVPVDGHVLYGNWYGRLTAPRQPGVEWSKRQVAARAVIPPQHGPRNSGQNIVVVIALAPGHMAGWARGIRISYRSAGQDYILLTQTRIVLVTALSRCQPVLKRLGF
jgi:hypothetical protein